MLHSNLPHSITALLILLSVITAQDQIVFNQQATQYDSSTSRDDIQSLVGNYDLEPGKTEQLLSDDHLERMMEHVRAHPEKRLVRWADGQQDWTTEGEKALLILKEGRRTFVDITDSWIANNRHDLPASAFRLDSDPHHLNPNFVTAQNSPSFPTKIQFGAQKLAPFIDDIQLSRMETRLSHFTNFRTRYYRSSTGKESQAWLLNEIRTLASESTSNVTVREFGHAWGQNTIIARFEPHGDSVQTDVAGSPTLIIGAHQDSTNLLPFLPAPGADDDGSGTVSILEAFSVLLHQGWSPAPNAGALEFMWFSAEEGGLLGSQEFARAYRNNNRVVSGMVQFDMTAFVKKGTTPSVGLVTDFVDPSLTQYLRLLIDEYLSIGWTNTKCGYACSDHASWINVNVPSAFAIESAFEDSNQKIHSTGDTIHQDEFSFHHMAEFSKLVLGLVIELKGLA
ncbi:hypothetical protein PCANC_02427 [Puccinia coronata f. sp. avenae]|uniref:Peptide hydrolase n=1 Tax=Puccinia coronata f. sp. avenae TaxID=200324 RepID=A0A2N5W4Z9_9BASI|nr:hypothetical protein PCASD_09173 [Puccinia coronata f. sp. avenae]PLW57280.1 hypothetical protein PCANC_02427 [Puccinia coronata f. sp. avenae]